VSACAASPARAQSPTTSPFQPSLIDPRNTQRFGASPPTMRGSASFAPITPKSVVPASGAGETGFDSTGSGKKKKPKKKAGEPRPLPPPPLPSPGPPQLADGHGVAQQVRSRQTYSEAYKPPDAIGRRPTPPQVDAFEPIGIRAGTFILKPAIEVTRGLDNNPSHIPGGKSSGFTTVIPEIHAQSDWERHDFHADLRGSYSNYDSISSLDAPSLDGKAFTRIDVNRDTKINMENRVLVATDYPGSPNLPIGFAKLPTYLSYGTSLGFTQSFNHLDLTGKGAVDRTDWQNTLLVDGEKSGNQDRDYTQYSGAARASYEIVPGVKPFVEIAGDTRIHDLQFDRDGYQRDSVSMTPRVGSTFEFTKKLTGEVSVGYLDRHYQDQRLQDLRGVVFDSTLKWEATGLTTVTLNANSRGDEVVVAGWSGALRRDFGVQVDHALRRWLIWTVRAGYGFDEYISDPCTCTGGEERMDKRVSLGTALTYKFNRDLSMKAEYRYDQLRSNAAGVDYNANAFLLGLKYQR
jgi:hypothetical protein